jgi:hypothetical protein
MSTPCRTCVLPERWSRATRPCSNTSRIAWPFASANNRPLPSTLATELLINPFLRSREASVKGAVQAWRSTADDAAAVFASLRQWKNEFR